MQRRANDLTAKASEKFLVNSVIVGLEDEWHKKIYEGPHPSPSSMVELRTDLARLEDIMPRPSPRMGRARKEAVTKKSPAANQNAGSIHPLPVTRDTAATLLGQTIWSKGTKLITKNVCTPQLHASGQLREVVFCVYLHHSKSLSLCLHLRPSSLK